MAMAFIRPAVIQCKFRYRPDIGKNSLAFGPEILHASVCWQAKLPVSILMSVNEMFRL